MFICFMFGLCSQILITQLDTLTEQQFMGICSLQHSSQQAEEALSQGLEQLQQSLVDTVAGGPGIEGIQQMAVALGKLTNLEGFVRQVKIINLREKTEKNNPLSTRGKFIPPCKLYEGCRAVIRISQGTTTQHKQEFANTWKP